MEGFLSIFSVIAQNFILPFFAIQFQFGDFSFTVGSIFAWLLIGAILMKFLRVIGGYLE